MFTGIIIATGHLVSIVAKSGDLELGIDAAALDAGRLSLGDSVSVQGVCLTVTRLEGPVFYRRCIAETLAKTTLGTLQRGARVNLEPSLRAGDPLGGHLVSGHVDAVGTVTRDARGCAILAAAVRTARAADALCGAEGVDLHRRRQFDGQRSERAALRRQHHSPHASK